MDPVVEERLRKGAGMLGKLWKSGDRCQTGWGVTEVDFLEGEDILKGIERWACQCQQKTAFCKAKSQWLRLAVNDLRDTVIDEYGIALMMTAAEWDLTGLTMKVELKDIGPVNIGPGGVCNMTDLWKHMPAPEALKSTLRVLGAFPHSRVEGVEEAPITSTTPAAVVDVEPLAAEVPGEEPA